MKATKKTGEELAAALARALQGMNEAQAAAANGRWKAALTACRRVARIARVHTYERLLAAALARTVLALAPLARTHPQRLRQLLEMLDEAVDAQPHDIDLAHALHDLLSALLTTLREETPPRRTRRALARLGLTYGRPLCERFPEEEAFTETCAALLELAQNA